MPLRQRTALRSVVPGLVAASLSVSPRLEARPRSQALRLVAALLRLVSLPAAFARPGSRLSALRQRLLGRVTGPSQPPSHSSAALRPLPPEPAAMRRLSSGAPPAEAQRFRSRHAVIPQRPAPPSAAVPHLPPSRPAMRGPSAPSRRAVAAMRIVPAARHPASRPQPPRSHPAQVRPRRRQREKAATAPAPLGYPPPAPPSVIARVHQVPPGRSR